MSSSLFRFMFKPASSLTVGVCVLACVFGGAPAFAEAAPQALPMAAGDAPVQASVEVIFTGFARHPDQGASVFVRLTGEVPVTLDRVGKRLTYRLSGAKLGAHNNANPLPTEHFGPPVANIALVQSSGGVDLVIDLSGTPGSAAPTHHMALQAGIATLHVELPPAVAQE
jgi:AMIN domain-containing protein